MLVENGQGLMLDRRRFLTLTAGSASATALLGLGGMQSAFAAGESVRWVSPRGTIEVLDDYPYWVAKKYGYLGDIQTTLEPGPSDATATVKLVDQKESTWAIPPLGYSPLDWSRGYHLSPSSTWGAATCSTSPSGRGKKRRASRTLKVRQSCSAAPGGSLSATRCFMRPEWMLRR